MSGITVLAATGNLGSGFFEESLASALRDHEIAVLACDSGSTDGGPYELGSGHTYFPRALYERDLGLMLKYARAHGVPIVIGSAAGAGSDVHVDFLADLTGELARKQGLHFRIARIYADQDKAYLLRRLEQGRITPLYPSEALAAETIERASKIVGMMGVEPIQQALRDGADVVIAGRATDTSLFAAVPLLRGAAPGPTWHAAKILECGAAATVKRIAPDCMMATVDGDAFIVWPPNPEMRSSTVSVAAHTLYENASPYRMREPSGTLDTTQCRYEQYDERRVRVHGSRFEHEDPYTIKLEAAELVGYQSLAIAGIRDPKIVSDLDWFLSDCRRRAAAKVTNALGIEENSSRGGYRVIFRVYGRDGSMGELEPRRNEVGHEVGLLIQGIAPTQDLAEAVVSFYRYVMLHNPVRGWTGQVTNLATPLAPATVNHGAVYRFTMNHVVAPDDPLEMFRTRMGKV